MSIQRKARNTACFCALTAFAVGCSTADDNQTVGAPAAPNSAAGTHPTALPDARSSAGTGSLSVQASAGAGVSGTSAATQAGADASPQTPVADAGTTSSEVVTYQRDIRPLLENNCVECHTAGGIGPSALDDWATVKTLAGAIVGAVSDGRMPPWPASSDCHPIQDARALPDASKALFSKWQNDGFLEGDAAEYVAPEKARRLDLGEPALTLRGDEPYTPAANGDSYRCFFAGTVDEDTFITALDIVPSVRSEVHHVILNRVDAASVEAVRNQDKEAASGGYPCSSAGVGGIARSQNLFSYRPGGVTVVMGQGEAVYLKAGSGLVLQVHYNTQFLPAGQVPTPDQTEIKIWSMPKGQTPERVVYRTGLLSPLNGSSDGNSFGLASSIPANASGVVGETTLAMRGVSVLGAGLTTGAVAGPFLPGEIVGMTPHAHAWATRLVASLKPVSGAEQCLIDVPDWDYNWQMDYMFSTGVPYTADDVLHVECDYDNTAANQPVVNGTKRPVQTVTFGESTLNEMCEHYLWLRFDYADFKAANP